MTEFKLANKKPTKSNSSSSAASQQQQQQPPPQQPAQQYSSTSYQMPSFTPMQSFQTPVKSIEEKFIGNLISVFFLELHSNEYE